MSIETTFAGLTLRNPIIIGSCGLTANAANNKALEQAGAGAIVLKSLFEENITRQTELLTDETAHGEAADYLQGYLGEHIVDEYIELIRESKRLCTIPIIASIACHTDGEWVRMAEKIEKAGADALELNVMTIRTDKGYADGELEKMHIDILRHVAECVKIPVIVKLGANLSNPVALIDKLCGYGAAGVVLFNRFYPTDIDVEKMEFVASHPFTTSADLSTSLRWTGIVSSAIKQMPLAVSGGVHTWQDVVKSILGGASAVEVSSVIYECGAQWIAPAIEAVEAWQQKQGYDEVAEYRGKMNARDPEHAERLLRTQFLKYMGTIK